MALAAVLFCCLLSTVSYSQSTRIKGRVTDSETGDPLPYANVFFKGTSIGVSTDDDGYYTLETRNLDVDLLRVEYVSYIPQEKKIKPGAFNQLDFQLKLEENLLSKIVVKPDYRYIRWILSNIEKNKKYNNPEERDRYQCRLYTKMELDLVNADTQIKNKLSRLSLTKSIINVDQQVRDELIREIFVKISDCLTTLLQQASKRSGLKDIIMSGGVSSSRFIRSYVSDRLEEEDIIVYFDDNENDLATDNAVGTALLGGKLLWD